MSRLPAWHRVQSEAPCWPYGLGVHVHASHAHMATSHDAATAPAAASAGGCAPNSVSWDVVAWADRVAAQVQQAECLLVLAGGVDATGTVLATVARRLDAAAELYRRNPGLNILCNGGGTSHKPKWRDPVSGFEVPEAQLMAQYLRAAGVPTSAVLLESLSDDTIGNAFCARALHTEWRPDLRRLVLITSAFQMDRAEAIYRWVFTTLQPAVGYTLTPLSVPDDGAVDPDALASRAQRECASLHAFQAGVGAKYSTMEEVHKWLFTTHEAYAPRTKARPPVDAAALKTY